MMPRKARTGKGVRRWMRVRVPSKGNKDMMTLLSGPGMHISFRHNQSLLVMTRSVMCLAF
jgi:hypothetical protein